MKTLFRLPERYDPFRTFEVLARETSVTPAVVTWQVAVPRLARVTALVDNAPLPGTYRGACDAEQTNVGNLFRGQHLQSHDSHLSLKKVW